MPRRRGVQIHRFAARRVGDSRFGCRQCLSGLLRRRVDAEAARQVGLLHWRFNGRMLGRLGRGGGLLPVRLLLLVLVSVFAPASVAHDVLPLVGGADPPGAVLRPALAPWLPMLDTSILPGSGRNGSIRDEHALLLVAASLVRHADQSDPDWSVGLDAGL